MAEHIASLQIPLDETKSLTIYANQEYSGETLTVKQGEEYTFNVAPSDRWKDWWIPASAKGFTNVLAWIVGLRVKGVKCFCLCGCLNQDDTTAFPIGLGTTKSFEAGGTISFFANDTRGYYLNNHGSITLKIRRVA